MKLRLLDIGLFLVGLSFVLQPAAGAPAPFSPIDPIAGYHNYDAMTRSLRSIASSRADLARLVSIGKSPEGRDIWVLEIGNNSGTPVSERPALLIVANLEGNQLVGSELSLKIANYLLDNYDSDVAVKDRLENAVFYILPRANPDGAERMFADLQTGQSGNTRPMDDDNDGRVDEDGPEDLNGDGYISVMRAPDPMGDYMVDPADDRLLKKADPSKGESGAFKVYWEGTDNDGDGFYNEDASGGVNLNRNFQHEYPYYKRGSGPHMVSEQETRAIMDFVIDHRNIASILTFGPHDNLVNAPNSKGELTAAKDLMIRAFADASYEEARTTGVFAAPRRGGFFFGGGQQDQSRTGRPSSGRKPETTVNKDDQEYFKSVSEKYKEIVGVSALPATETPAGAFFEYGYYQFGVPSFATPGWAPSVKGDADSTAVDTTAAAGETGRARGPSGGRGAAGAGARGNGSGNGGEEASIDVTLAKWMDAAGVDGFVPWSTYSHPTLGDVEIGGFKPYEFANPPMETVDELGPKHGAFVVSLASLFAKVQIAKTEVTDHGGGVFRIKAEVENAGYLPTSTAHGVTSRSVKPTMVQLDIEPEALLSGDAKTSFFPAMDGSGKRSDFEWIISGRRGDTVELRVVSQKGGSDTARIRLE
jgi:hypothetical protein